MRLKNKERLKRFTIFFSEEELNIPKGNKDIYISKTVFSKTSTLEKSER